MKLGELFELLQGGASIKVVAKEQLGVSIDTLRRRLKKIGYQYDKILNKWDYVGEGEEPLHIDLKKEVQPIVVSKVEAKVEEKVEEKNEVVIEDKVEEENEVAIEENVEEENEVAIEENVEEFVEANLPVVVGVNEGEITDDFINMVNSFNKFHDGVVEIDPIDELVERIDNLVIECKVRKTIVINRSVAELFDEVSKKLRFNKSDIIHIALLDFVKKYDSK